MEYFYNSEMNILGAGARPRGAGAGS
jgi:hypothetical protein